MGPQFFQTRMGQRFFEVTLPRIADELASMNNNLAALVALLRERVAAESGVPVAVPSERKRP
jgi:hypothetical protein